MRRGHTSRSWELLLAAHDPGCYAPRGLAGEARGSTVRRRAGLRMRRHRRPADGRARSSGCDARSHAIGMHGCIWRPSRGGTLRAEHRRSVPCDRREM